MEVGIGIVIVNLAITVVVAMKELVIWVHSVIRVGIRIMIVVNMNIVDMEVVRVGEVAMIDGVDVA